jgi:autotransporter-associated beta strand protein
MPDRLLTWQRTRLPSQPNDDYTGADPARRRQIYPTHAITVSGDPLSTCRSGTTLTFNSPITGGGDIEKTGTGTLILSNVNSYSGGTTVDAGALSVGTDSALGSGTVTLGGGTALAFATTGDFMTNGIKLQGDRTFFFDNGRTDAPLGNIADASAGVHGDLVKTGAGKLVLGETTVTPARPLSRPERLPQFIDRLLGSLRLCGGGRRGSRCRRLSRRRHSAQRRCELCELCELRGGLVRLIR